MMHLVGIASRNLLQQRRRTLLVGAGLGLVTALLISLLGMTRAIEGTLYHVSTTVLGGHVTLGGLFKPTLGRAVPALEEAPRLRELIAAQVPEATYVAGRVLSDARVSSPRGTLTNYGTQVLGISLEEEPALRQVLSLKAGSLDGLDGPLGGAVLFETEATTLGVGLGDLITLVGRTTQGARNAVDLPVVALGKGGGGALSVVPTVIVSRTSLQALHGMDPSTVSVLQVHLVSDAPPEAVSSVQGRLRAALSGSGQALLTQQGQSWAEQRAQAELEPWVGQRLYVSSWEEEYPYLNSTLEALSALIAFVAIILLGVVCIGLFSMLWLSVRERTREIGTLRAIGMGRGEVVLLFLLEGLFLGAVAAVVGAGAGVGAGALLEAAQLPVSFGLQRMFGLGEQLGFEFTPDRIVQVVLLVAGCATVFSVPAALLAARQPPLLSLNHVR